MTKNPLRRYTQKELAGGELKITAKNCDKSKILELERKLHETLPLGPEERQLYYRILLNRGNYPIFPLKVSVSCVMWYEKLGIISIGAQCGGPDDGGMGDMKVELWKLLLKHCKNSHCPSIAHYALALRIGGQFQDFSKEGVANVKRSNKEFYIGADIVIPESVWRTKNRNQLRDYLADQVRGALQMCVWRIRKDKDPVDEISLFGEVDLAIGEFKKINF